MFILASERNQESLMRVLRLSLLSSLFCLIFYLIYDLFSHGVHSPFMTFLFAWPLFLCALPTGLILLVKALPGPSLLSMLLWNTAAAVLTVSSMLRGVFDIAGNSSVYQEHMMKAGFVLLLSALFFYFAGIVMKYISPE